MHTQLNFLLYSQFSYMNGLASSRPHGEAGGCLQGGRGLGETYRGCRHMSNAMRRLTGASAAAASSARLLAELAWACTLRGYLQSSNLTSSTPRQSRLYQATPDDFRRRACQAIGGGGLLTAQHLGSRHACSVQRPILYGSEA